MSLDTDKGSGFLIHLEALRAHLIRSVLSVCILGVVVFVFKGLFIEGLFLAPLSPEFVTNSWFCELSQRYDWVNVCINQEQVNLQSVIFSGLFMAHLKASLLLAGIIAFPYMLWEIGSFIYPALTLQERRYSLGLFIGLLLLFYAGVLFGYFILTPISVHFFINYSLGESIVNTPTIGSYTNLMFSLVLGSGLIFELPAIIYVLGRIGIVSSSMLKRYRKHAIIVVLTISAILTPPDIFSQVLIFLPVYALYELSIRLVDRIEQNKA